MVKNVLLASAAAFVVFGSAASLTNMKAVITSGNGAEAALTRDAFDMNAQLTELRVEQARQATLLSVQETVLDRLQRDARRIEHGNVMSGMDMIDDSYDIGLDIPTPQRERWAVDYAVAWTQAIAMEAELGSFRTQYRELEAASAERIAALESAAAERVSRAENETQFEIARLKEEIEQRDNSIVSLMHKLVSLQSGANVMPAQALPESRAVSAAPAVKRPVEVEPRKSAGPAVETVAQPVVRAVSPTDGTVANPGSTVADGIAAYRAGDYRHAFEIWRPLANAGDTRASFHLGALYFEGRGVPRELETAHLLLGRAAAAGHSGAAALIKRVEVEMAEAQVATAPANVRR